MKRERLDSIISNFPEKRIGVVGDLMLDVYLCGKATRISPEAPVPVVRVKDKELRLGGAANVMLNVITLGGKASAFGVTGNDPNGKAIEKLLAAEGIRNSSVYPDPQRRTTEKQRVMAGAQQLVRIDFEDTLPIPAQLREKITEDIISEIEKHNLDALIFEDYAKGVLSLEMLQKVIEVARANNVMVSLDPHISQLLEVKRLTLLKPNRSEAFALAGTYCSDPAESAENDSALIDVAGKLIKRWEPDYLLISLGPQGLALFAKDGSRHFIPTQAREVYDVSGAGDTVMAAFTLSLAGGADGIEAAIISNHAAGIVVGKIGTATVSTEELRENFKYDK
ncbi:MAG: hypothetical protein A2020_12795 [Lentisphaerae bacterium GWF2_45_14]|nr:MAG: hypothetical protein A2020_12795 [Lentisphaerae bacterium GWF2_45_14]